MGCVKIMLIIVKLIAMALLGALITMGVMYFRDSFNGDSDSSFYQTSFRIRPLIRLRFGKEREPVQKIEFYIAFIILYIVLAVFCFKTDNQQHKWYAISFCSGSAVFFAKYFIEDYFK
jgi:peptidoglycan/LPS O-acetylase OafA/YrhL